MADHPIFVRVSRPNGHYTTTRVAAERAGWKVLQEDPMGSDGRPKPFKPRVPVEDAPKLRRRKSRRGDPTPKPEAPASAENN